MGLGTEREETYFFLFGSCFLFQYGRDDRVSMLALSNRNIMEAIDNLKFSLITLYYLFIYFCQTLCSESYRVQTTRPAGNSQSGYIF